MILIPVVSTERATTKFVFTNFNTDNGLGITSYAYIFVLGLLMSQYTITGYDASAHMVSVGSVFMIVLSFSWWCNEIKIVVDWGDNWRRQEWSKRNNKCNWDINTVWMGLYIGHKLCCHRHTLPPDWDQQLWWVRHRWDLLLSFQEQVWEWYRRNRVLRHCCCCCVFLWHELCHQQF